jgi:hypothetical protein
MSRYLVRLPNRNGYTPRDVPTVTDKIRNIIGSPDKASHFRIGQTAIEFNLFANTQEELDTYSEKFEKEFSRILLLKPLDQPSETIETDLALKEGVDLFNQERFWESHEILEQAWKQSHGQEKEAIQALILTAAAFVHQQKGEDSISLSILARAREKLGKNVSLPTINLSAVRDNLDRILESNLILPFKIYA